jgi:hypothetical protein
MAYAWEDDPLTTEGARSLDDMVSRALQLASGLQAAWSLATENGKVWESSSYLRRMQAIDFLATVVVDILTRTRNIIASTQAKHPDWVGPKGTTDVDSILRIIKQLADTARETFNWLNRSKPPVNEDMLRRSRESLDRGEGEPISDMIARLNSGGPLVEE